MCPSYRRPGSGEGVARRVEVEEPTRRGTRACGTRAGSVGYVAFQTRRASCAACDGSAGPAAPRSRRSAAWSGTPSAPRRGRRSGARTRGPARPTAGLSSSREPSSARPVTRLQSVEPAAHRRREEDRLRHLRDDERDRVVDRELRVEDAAARGRAAASRPRRSSAPTRAAARAAGGIAPAEDAIGGDAGHRGSMRVTSVGSLDAGGGWPIPAGDRPGGASARPCRGCGSTTRSSAGLSRPLRSEVCARRWIDAHSCWALTHTRSSRRSARRADVRAQRRARCGGAGRRRVERQREPSAASTLHRCHLTSQATPPGPRWRSAG